MKRILKAVLVLVVVVVLVAAALIAPAFLGRQAAGEGQIVSGIRLVKDGFVSVAVIPLSPQQVALIDAGNDSSGRAIRTDLVRSGLGVDSVTAILLTHGHPDHTGAVSSFPNAQVMALAEEVPLIEGRVSGGGPLPRLFPARPTGIKVARPLRDGDSFSLGPSTTVRVYSVPGHTAGSAAYFVNGVLFLGDAADIGSDGAIKVSPWVFSDSQDQDRQSLIDLTQRLERDHVDVKTIVFAHSGVLTTGLNALKTFADANQ